MTTKRRATTRRFAFKEPNHGGPRGRAATQPQNETATSTRRRGQRPTLSRHHDWGPSASDFPTDFPTAAAGVGESLQTTRVGHQRVAVSKTGYGVLSVRGFESLPLRLARSSPDLWRPMPAGRPPGKRESIWV